MYDAGQGITGRPPVPPVKRNNAAYNLGRSISSGAATIGRSFKSSSGGGSGGYSGGGGGYSGGGGGYSGGGGGGGGGYSAPRTPSAPSLAAYLGTDSVYQDALSAGKRTLADFLSQLGQKRSQATTQYNNTSASMERDRLQQLADLRDEFASRGLIQSGLYGQEQGKFNQQFTDQRNALQQQQTALLADLLSQEQNYRREQDLAIQAAKQQALQRRAAKYNIG